MTDGRTFPDNARDMGVTHHERCWRYHPRCREQRMRDIHTRLQAAHQIGDEQLVKRLTAEYAEVEQAQ